MRRPAWQGLLGLDCEEGAGGAFRRDRQTTAKMEFFWRMLALRLTLEELDEDVGGIFAGAPGEGATTAQRGVLLENVDR